MKTTVLKNVTALTVIFCIAMHWTCRADAAETSARTILDATGVTGGLVVQLGCEDVTRLAAFGSGDAYRVHGLDTDPAKVERARKTIHAQGQYGKVSAATFDGSRLPYVDNLVNLLVAEELGDVAMDEVLRVLAPGGTVYLRQNGRWAATVKPWPDGIDPWTHYLHGPDNNAVAADRVASEPRSIQWISSPRFGRSHEELASLSMTVTAGGRIFAIIDEAPFASIRFQGQWQLVARDAFNGMLLWKKEIPRWNDHLRHFRSGPVHLQRRLVADDDRIYTTLGLAAPVSAICAASGTTERVYDGTEATEEILLDDGVLYLVVGTSESDRVGGGLFRRGEPEATDFRHIVAVDVETGRMLWKHAFGRGESLLPLTLAVRNKSVYFQSTDGVARLDAKSGDLVWKTPRATLAQRMGFSAPTLVVTENVVLCADREPAADKPGLEPTTDGHIAWGVHGWNEPGFIRKGPSKLRAYAVETGKESWSADCTEQYNTPTDLFVVDNVAWVGSNFRGYDLDSGELVRELAWKGDPVAMPHHRCYRNKATEDYLFTGRSGVEVVSFKDGWIGNNSWVRGTCQYGIMPANGFIYAPPNACACYNKVRVQGFFAATGKRGNEEPDDAVRLVKGPAYSSAMQDPTLTAIRHEWPMYRADNARSGYTPGSVPTELRARWSAKLGGRLTQPIVVNGRVFVASTDSHAVHALRADDGEPLWSFIAGGRIDSSPTCYRGTVLFGAADGWVYCLRADDGQLAWRFRAAPRVALVGAFEQLESIWPVHGSVLVQNDTIHVVAGRNSYLDGGLVLCQLDPATGKERARSVLHHLDPETGRQTGHEGSRGFDMEGVRSDILSGDGDSIFLKHFRFDRDGQVMDQTEPHLFTISGFLGEEWFVRSYWIVGTTVGAGWGGWANAAGSAPAGRILAFDDDDIFGYGRATVSSGPVGHRADSYHLWRREKAAALANMSSSEAPSRKGEKGKPGKKGLVAPRWSDTNSLIVRAMTLTPDKLFIAGPPDLGQKTAELLAFENESEALAGFHGKRGVFLRVLSADDGSTLAEYPLDAMPVFDAMSAAEGKLFLSLQDGTVVCWGGK